MPVTPEEQPSLAVLEARIEALRELVDERDHRYEDRFTAIDEKTGLALSTSKEANTKSEAATEKRFDTQNEFRGQLKDQAATLLPRVEADAKFTALEDKLNTTNKTIDSKIEAIKLGGTATFRWTADKLLVLAIAAVGWILLLMRK